MNLRQLRVLALAKQQPQAAKQKSQGRGAPLSREARAAGGESPEPAEPVRSEAASAEPDGKGGGGRRDMASAAGDAQPRGRRDGC